MEQFRLYTTIDNKIIELDFKKIIQENDLTKDCELGDCIEIAEDILMTEFDDCFIKDRDRIATEIYHYINSKED